jgi:cytochrome c oxidase cbb3-type subunit 3
MRVKTVALIIAAFLTVSCQRDKRDPQPAGAGGFAAAPASLPLFPPQNPNKQEGAGGSPYEGNAYAISEGQNLFNWFNCAGCHSSYGGGGIGPALNDDVWIYGGDPRSIFETIVHGRPNGMPAWGGRIPEDRIWQLVAYVRSLSGNEPKTATPPRDDGIERNPANIKSKVQGQTR